MLTMLPECGDNYLPVFRCVHGFCVGEGFLGLSDEPLLVEQMKLCEAMEGGEALEEKKEEEGDLAKGGRKCERNFLLVHSVCSLFNTLY